MLMVGVKNFNEINMMKRFLRLQSRGVSLRKTFETLELHERGGGKTAIEAMKQKLEAGTLLSVVFSEIVMDQKMREMLVTAERGHNFIEGLEQVLALSTMRQKLMQELKQLARYPLIILSLLLSLGAIYALYIFPKLLTMVDLNDLSGFHSILLSKYFFPGLFILVLIIGVFIYLSAKKNRTIAIPFIERGRRLYITYLFVSELSLLHEGHSSVRQVIERLSIGEGETAKIAARMHQRMSSGIELENAAREEPMIEHEVVSLFGVGTMSGELGTLMVLHRDLIFEEMEAYWKQLILRIEPMLYGFLTIMVTIMFYTIYLPVKLIMAQL